MIRTASRQGRHGRQRPVRQRRPGALRHLPAALISLHSWRAAFIAGADLPRLAIALWRHWRAGAVGDRQMPATSAANAGRDAFWRVFVILSITMFVEGVQWQAMMYGAGLLFSGCLAGEIEAIRAFFGRHGVETQVVLWVGLATSLIYVLSGVAQYVIGNRVLDRYRLKTIYVIATGLGAFAMLMVAEGSGLVVLAGAVIAAILSSATGPVENLLIARYTPSRFHGLGFGAKFVIAFGVGWLAIKLISAVKERTGDLGWLFLGLAAAAAAMCLVSLLLPSGERREGPAALAQPAE